MQAAMTLRFSDRRLTPTRRTVSLMSSEVPHGSLDLGLGVD